MRFVVAALALISIGCARAAREPELIPLPAPVPVDTTPAVVVEEPPPPPPDTMVSYRMPAFQAEPLLAWGPLPPGDPKPERHRSYDLQHQSTRVRFDWPRRAVVGSTTLRFAALDTALSVASFDAVEMRIASVRTLAGAILEHAYDGRTLTVTLKPRLAARARTSIVVDYETVRPKKGAYFIDRKHAVWTQGEPEDTRHWVPTYDHPNDKTTWEFFITTSRTERALSNGRLVTSRSVPNGTEWHWSQTKAASTYLMSIVVGDYVVLQDVWNTISIGYWTYPDSVEAAWRGFGQTPRMVDLFSERSGVPYPWAKYDQSVAPDYIFGGMENVTATTQADDRILHPEWAEPQASAEALVAHELGHQWYGNYLTARSWSDVWLHEGFATFLEAIWAEQGHGTDAGAIARLAEQQETIAADRSARRPLVFDRWVTDPLELFLSGHVYAKGASVLQMLRHQLGDSLFWAAMQTYTTSHALGSVVTTDFQRDFQRASRRDLTSFFDQWVYGAGFPVFRISHAYDSATTVLTLTAQQVQPRDTLTGFFDADVDVEVLTDVGPVRGTVPVRGETAELRISLSSPPRAIRWDKGGWLLDLADFPRSTVMLAYQLRHDDDVLGRIEAADLLAGRAGQPKAVTALAQALEEDSAWAVRVRAAAALASFAADSVTVHALLRATGDRDPRVRERAAAALGVLDARGTAPSDTVRVTSQDSAAVARAARALAMAATRLRELIDADPSRYVRGAALVAYTRLAPAEAPVIIETALTRDSWLDMERTNAVRALALLDTPQAWASMLRFIEPSVARTTRLTAITSVVGRARGREVDLAPLLVPLLGDDDLFIRIAAARALGSLGVRSVATALEARLAVEAEGRVITAILGALASLQPKE
jgi:aminopeptidase N